MQLTPTIQFAALTPAQKGRIAVARDGKQPSDMAPSSQGILDAYIAKTSQPSGNGKEEAPAVDLSKLPQMDAETAVRLANSIDLEFQNPFMGPLPGLVQAQFRHRLDEIVEKLEQADFTVPEKVIDSIVKAYDIARS